MLECGWRQGGGGRGIMWVKARWRGEGHNLLSPIQYNTSLHTLYVTVPFFFFIPPSVEILFSTSVFPIGLLQMPQKGVRGPPGCADGMRGVQLFNREVFSSLLISYRWHRRRWKGRRTVCGGGMKGVQLFSREVFFSLLVSCRWDTRASCPHTSDTYRARRGISCSWDDPYIQDNRSVDETNKHF